MKFTSPALLLLCLPAFSSAQVQQAHLRYISIGKAGAATALAAAASSADISGHQLFDQLMADAAAGKATVLADQETVIRSGQRGKVEAVRHFPVPTDFTLTGPAGLILPSEFTTEHHGQILEAELTVTDDPLPGAGRRGLDINLAPERSDSLNLYPWPVPGPRGAGQNGDGMLRLPLAAVQKTATQALTWTGNTALVSISPAPTASLSDGEPVFCYQFIRAGLTGETPAPPDARRTAGGMQERRLHAITLRLPRQEAAALMLQADGDDAALYARLTGMVSAGTATLSGHSAVVCREGQRSKVESHVNFPQLNWRPGDRDFPVELRNIGETMEAETSNPGTLIRTMEDGQPRLTTIPEDHTGPRGTWNIALERQSGLEMVPWHPDSSKPGAGAVPEYVEENLSAQLRIPPSGILCAGIISSSPATRSSGPEPDPEGSAEEGATDITFVTQTPSPGNPAKGARPQIHLQAFMLSLPAGDGAVLAAALKSAGGAPIPAGPWTARFLQGEFPCAAQASCVVFSGQRSRMLGVRKVRHLETKTFTPAASAKSPPPSSPQPQTSVVWEQKDCGVSLTTEYSGDDHDPLMDITWEWDTAPVLTLDEADSSGTGIEARRCHQKIELKDRKLPRARPVIADVRPSNARQGSPEHGRWHALVLLAR